MKDLILRFCWWLCLLSLGAWAMACAAGTVDKPDALEEDTQQDGEELLLPDGGSEESWIAEDGADETGELSPGDEAGPPDPNCANPVPPDPLPVVNFQTQNPPSQVQAPPGTRFFKNVPYGSDPKMTLDLFLPPQAAQQPVALVIYFHPGAYISGSKESIYNASAWGGPEVIERILQADIAFATVGYTLASDLPLNTEGAWRSLLDMARGIQFLRAYADQLDLDPTRLGLMGGSAGAGASVWLACRDDLMDLCDPDPIAQQSTRVTAVGALGVQSTYDLLQWDQILDSPGLIDLISDPSLAPDANHRARATELNQMLRLFYAIPSAVPNSGIQAFLATPQLTARRAEMDSLAWLDASDPPMLIEQPGTGMGTASGPCNFVEDGSCDVLHHALHAVALDQRSNKIDAQVGAAEYDLPPDADSFLIQQLQ